MNFLIIWIALLGACGGGDDSSDDGSPPIDRFQQGILPDSLKDGGYIDSVFINNSGDRIYFIYSIYPINVLNGSSDVSDCTAKIASLLPGHVSIPGVEWNTDIYYVEWDGANWSEPINAGSPVNTLAMECCMWLNDDETEMIFYRSTDLDGDGTPGDLSTGPTGNFRTSRSTKSDPWGTPIR